MLIKNWAFNYYDRPVSDLEAALAKPRQLQRGDGTRASENTRTFTIGGVPVKVRRDPSLGDNDLLSIAE